jgi:site-specific DNA-methyltransferase (adenine-specific)
MAELPDESVDLIVTSPPYGIGLQYEGYNNDGGEQPPRTEGQVEIPVLSMADYEAYLKRLEPVWDECWRVLAPSGYACLNMINVHAKAEFFGHSFSLPTYEDVVYYWRKKLGAEYKWAIRWLAPRNSHGSDGTNLPVKGSYPIPLEGHYDRLFEDIAVLRKLPPVGWKRSEEREARRRKSALTLDQWKEAFSQLWKFPGSKSDEHNGILHPASYPEELPTRCIRAYSVIGDTVLDPFLGTGTTLLAARKLGRKCIGYEVEARYRDLIANKTQMMAASIGHPSVLDDY